MLAKTLTQDFSRAFLSRSVKDIKLSSNDNCWQSFILKDIEQTIFLKLIPIIIHKKIECLHLLQNIKFSRSYFRAFDPSIMILIHVHSQFFCRIRYFLANPLGLYDIFAFLSPSCPRSSSRLIKTASGNSCIKNCWLINW